MNEWDGYNARWWLKSRQAKAEWRQGAEEQRGAEQEWR
jgi:hypothetical protein